MRHWVASLALAAMLSVLLAPGAAAGEQWCEDDPPVVITTPLGAHVVVYVTNGAQGAEHLVAVQLASISYTVTSIDGGRATLVRMAVTIPPDQFASSFATRSTVSTGPYKTLDQLATTRGRSGRAMRLEFRLDVP